MMERDEPVPQFSTPATSRSWPWLRMLLGAGLGIFVLWYVSRDIALAQLSQTVMTIRPIYVLASGLLVVITIVVRAWRWYLTFQPPGIIPPFRPLFWSLTLGQLLNLILPFRMGDVGRLVQLERWCQPGASRTLGTIVVEKALDMAALGVLLLLVLPLATAFMGGSPVLIAAATLLALLLLYLMAYQGEGVIRLSYYWERLLPAKIAGRLHHWLVTGLGGLDALRYQKANLRLVGMTGLVSALSIAIPLVLFPALELPLGLGEAILLHVILTFGSVPASTPLNMGVFEGITVLLLKQFGITDDAAALTYAILWHLALLIPQIILGSLAAAFRPIGIMKDES